MAARRITPLNGADGYMRWKESMLLALHSGGLAHLLSDDPPPPLVASDDGGARATAAAVAVAKQWARDDAVCRGHILAAISDRLLPDYARHATARALWDALARTYDLVAYAPAVAWRRFTDFAFDDGEPLLELLAHAEALAVAGHSGGSLPDDGEVARALCQKLPAYVRATVQMWSTEDRVTMDTIWAVARAKEVSRLQMGAVEPAATDMSSPEHTQA